MANSKSETKDEEFINELANQYYSDKQLIQNRIKERIFDYRRFSCFNIASNRQLFGNSLFWANYAGKHYGICMKFRGDFLLAQNSFQKKNIDDKFNSIPIKYTKKIPKFNFIRYRLRKGRTTSTSKYFLGTKSKEWKYENEIRFIYESTSKFETDFLNVRFNPNLLEKVYLGCKLQKTEIDNILSIFQRKEYKHVKISKLTLAHNSFKLLEQKIR